MNLRALFTRKTYPLHEAVYAMDLERIKSLLENGADLNQVDGDGITAIELAAKLIVLARYRIKPRTYSYDCISIFLDQPNHQLSPEVLGNVFCYSFEFDDEFNNKFINKLLMQNLRIDWTKEAGAKLLQRLPEHVCRLLRDNKKEIILFLFKSGADSAAYLSYRKNGSIIEVFTQLQLWDDLLIFLNEIQKGEPTKLTRIEYLDNALKNSIEKSDSTLASQSRSTLDDAIQALIKTKRALIKAMRKDLTWKTDNTLAPYYKNPDTSNASDPLNLLTFRNNRDLIALLFAYSSYPRTEQGLINEYIRPVASLVTKFGMLNHVVLARQAFLEYVKPGSPSFPVPTWLEIISSVDAFLNARYVIMSLHHHIKDKMGIQPDNAYLTLLPLEIRSIIVQLAFQEILAKFSLSKPNEFLTNYLEIIKEEESLMEEAKEEAPEEAKLTEVFKIIYPAIIAYRSTRKIDFLADKKDKTPSQLIADLKKEIMSHPQDSVSTAWSLAKKYKDNYLQNNQMNVDLFLEILLYTFEHHGLLKACSFLGLTFYLPSSLRTYISQLTADDKKIIAQQIAELSLSPTLLESADNRHTLIITAFKNALPKPSPLLRQGLLPLSPLSPSVRVEEVAADVVETPRSAPPLPSAPEMNTNQFFALMAQAPEAPAARPERTPARRASL